MGRRYAFAGSFYRRSRYHFGYSYYYPFASYSPYPFYRRTYYEPYYLTSWSYRCPSYRTYYYTSHTADYPVDYVEVVDPYVESDDVLSSAEYASFSAADVLVDDYADGEFIEPIADDFEDPFARPFVHDVADGLRYDEYLVLGEESLHRADYMRGAEAFRRANKSRPDEDYALFRLGASLFGAGEYGLALYAVESGLELEPARVFRRLDMSVAFGSKIEFKRRLADLEKHLVSHEDDLGARFLLAYCYYYSGELFAARGLFRDLEELGFRSPHLDAFAKEAERRLVER